MVTSVHFLPFPSQSPLSNTLLVHFTKHTAGKCSQAPRLFFPGASDPHLITDASPIRPRRSAVAGPSFCTRLPSLQALPDVLSPRNQDPPGYWDDIVWPAYLSAHRSLFLNGDVEAGPPDPDKIDGLVLLEASQLGMEDMVRKTCEVVFDRVSSGKTAKDWRKP